MQKSILITGGSRGIGHALVRKFLDNDYNVLTISRNTDSLKALKSKDLTIVEGDITKNENLKLLLEEMLLLNVEGMINNAASLNPVNFKLAMINDLRMEFETNFFAPIKLIQAILRQQNISKVLNISTGAAENPVAGMFGYCTSKGAMHHAMKCLNLEYPDTRFANVRPGMVDTAMQEQLRNADKNKFSNANYYKEAHAHAKLFRTERVADFIYKIWNQPPEKFSAYWDIHKENY